MTERALPAAPRERELSDLALALVIGAVLFVISAWPLLLVELPPLQDLPNHLASAYIADHLDRYPEYVFNGFWKSNSLLEIWLHLLSDHLCFAGRTFAALTLAVNALVLPWFLLHFAGRRTMVTAALLVWPLVHGFTFAMGMLNFAIAMPLSLIVLVLLDRQRQAPRQASSLPRSLAITGLSVVAWLAHPFPLILVGLLCAIESGIQRDWRARVRVGVATLLPLAPIGLLIVGTALHHMVKAAGAPAAASHGFELLSPWELPAHFWLDASGALTRWGSTTVIPAIALPVLAWRHRHERRPMFGSVATIALIVGYLGLPLMISNWWYLNTRIAPLLWLAFAVRVPPVLPRRLVAVLAASALVFSVALGVDYVRLDRDRAELTAGIAAVPEGATLLPLLFQHRKTSDYIASLTHAWGFYVLAKQTTAPLAFAVERSYPITYRVFPPAPLIPPALDRFAALWATPELACAADRGNLGRSLEDCTALWRLTWAQFWRLAEPRFNFILAWAMPPMTRAIIPASYQRVLAAGDLEIYARIAVSAER
jgi:hypothetical protein